MRKLAITEEWRELRSIKPITHTDISIPGGSGEVEDTFKEGEELPLTLVGEEALPFTRAGGEDVHPLTTIEEELVQPLTPVEGEGQGTSHPVRQVEHTRKVEGDLKDACHVMIILRTTRTGNGGVLIPDDHRTRIALL